MGGELEEWDCGGGKCDWRLVLCRGDEFLTTAWIAQLPLSFEGASMTFSRTGEDASDPFDFGRFLAAQASDYQRALAELRGGRKRSHWMWYIFPQYLGLGNSSMSQRFAIRSLKEAQAYLNHPVLGPRLLECAQVVVALEGRTAAEVFGYPDDMKLKSCATLFAKVSPKGAIFECLLAKYFQGDKDQRTLELIQGES